MKLYNIGLLTVSLLGTCIAIPVSRTDALPIIDLGYSKYEGKHLYHGVNQHLGISYAAPPLGELRWRAPLDPIENSSLQDATKHSPICLGQAGLEAYESSAEKSEDCLYLDIWAPAGAAIDAGYPVHLYLPGGGYGINANAQINGSKIVYRSNNSIVFVYVNYRVGVYGFLAGEQVRQDVALNAGLLDQRKALEWVQRHIDQFGGNASRVTVHGGSAGAGSIAYHLSAFGGRNDDLFQAAIVQSAFWPLQETVAQAQARFDFFAANTSCGDVKDTMTCLRSKNTSDLQASNRASPPEDKPATLTPFWEFLPVIDGAFIRTSLYEAYQTGAFFTVPTILGNDQNEGTYFAPNASTSAEFLSFILSNYPYLSNTSLEAINATYGLGNFPLLPMHNPAFTSIAAAYGESTFNCPGNVMMEALSGEASEHTWAYHTTIVDEQYQAIGLGTPHLFETTAIFGPGQDQPCNGCSFETYNAPIVPVIMDYVISFVKTYNPNTLKNAAAPLWETACSGAGGWTDWYDDGNAAARRMNFKTNATAMDVTPVDEIARCALWNSLADELQQ